MAQVGTLGQPALCLPEPGPGHHPELSLPCPGMVGTPGMWPEASLPCTVHGAAGPLDWLGSPHQLSLLYIHRHTLWPHLGMALASWLAHTFRAQSITYLLFLTLGPPTATFSLMKPTLHDLHSPRGSPGHFQAPPDSAPHEFSTFPTPRLSPQKGPSFSWEGWCSSLPSQILKEQRQRQDQWVPGTLWGAQSSPSKALPSLWEKKKKREDQQSKKVKTLEF